MQQVENPWKQLAQALDKLCVCYRMQRRASDKLLEEIAKFRVAAERLDLQEAEQCIT